MQFFKYRLWRSCRCACAVPRIHHVFRETRFLHCGHFRHLRRALFGRHRQRTHFAGFDVIDQGRQIGYGNRNLPADQIEQAARTALTRDRSSAIVLGCAGMAPLCRELTQRLGVPVIDGVSVAVKWAEALAALGLQTSKGGDYALPLPKSYSGWAQAQGWPAGQTPD